MGLLLDIMLYIIYMAMLFAVSLAIKYQAQSPKKVVDGFFKYVARGRGKVPRLREHPFGFFMMQMLYPLFAILMMQKAYMSFTERMAISVVVAYAYARQMDTAKRHRHNGIRIGYEYPHPVNFAEQNIGIAGEDRKPSIVVNAGSKGVYDLQIKEEPNPHMMIIGESGLGKSNLITTMLTRAYLKFKIPFLIMDWSGIYGDMGATTWNVPKNLRINPFALRGMQGRGGQGWRRSCCRWG